MRLLVAAILAAGAAAAASLNGKVSDARTGEPLSKVKVVLTGEARSVLTDSNGEFELHDVPDGEVELYITTIGYGLVKRKARVGERLDIALHPEASVRTDNITVSSGAFEYAAVDATSEQTLSKPEIQALSMVIIADPLRAAQSLPGVTSNNDFRAEFAVRGASYEHVGIFVDGVLTDGFVHSANLGIGGGTSSEKVSLSIINADTVNEMALYPGAYPSRFGGTTAAVLNLATRDGNFVKRSGRIATGLLVSSAAVDGPFARGKGSWLLTARASSADYLQRMIERITGTGRYSSNPRSRDDANLNFSDAQNKIVYNFSPRHQAGISSLYGQLFAHDNLQPGTTGVERINRLQSHNMMLNAFWRYTPGAHLTTQTRIFALTSGLQDKNRNGSALDDRDVRQIGLRYDVGYTIGEQNVEAGVYVRSTREQRISNAFSTRAPTTPRVLENFRKRATEHSYYLQNTWRHERFLATAGGRIMHSNLTGQTVLSPRLALTWNPGNNWTLRTGAGSFAQFPTIEQLFGFFGNAGLRAERATHVNLGVERRLGSRMRVFAELYDREDRSQIFSLWEPRLVNDRAVANFVPYGNLVRGYARGIEMGLQRRSANGLTGWLSYAYMVSRYQDRADAIEFPGDFDQRHTITAFANYRFRPTVDAGALWRFGTGQPIPGFIVRDGEDDLALTDQRNTTRLPRYSRLDVRINKAFLFQRWKLTLSGEVLNVLGRKNVIVLATDPVRIFSSGRFSADLEESFGILPSVRVVFEF